MKAKIILGTTTTLMTLSAFAGTVDSSQPLPEPSTLGLFAAAAIAITLVAKFKK